MPGIGSRRLDAREDDQCCWEQFSRAGSRVGHNALYRNTRHTLVKVNFELDDIARRNVFQRPGEPRGERKPLLARSEAKRGMLAFFHDADSLLKRRPWGRCAGTATTAPAATNSATRGLAAAAAAAAAARRAQPSIT